MYKYSFPTVNYWKMKGLTWGGHNNYWGMGMCGQWVINHHPTAELQENGKKRRLGVHSRFPGNFFPLHEAIWKCCWPQHLIGRELQALGHIGRRLHTTNKSCFPHLPEHFPGTVWLSGLFPACRFLLSTEKGCYLNYWNSGWLSFLSVFPLECYD